MALNLEAFVGTILNSVLPGAVRHAQNMSGGGAGGTGSFGSSAAIVGPQGTSVPGQDINQFVGGSGQPGTGYTTAPSQSTFGSSVKSAIAYGMAGVTPDVNDAMTLDMYTNRTRAFGSSTSYLDVFKMQEKFANAGTMISPLDASAALSTISRTGMSAGSQQFGATAKSATQISNVMPGIGGAEGAVAAMNMQQPGAVNMANALGFNLRNQKTGAIAIGYQAGSQNQQTASVAIGYLAGQNTQGQLAVAIGYYAGNTAQGASAIAIGDQSGLTAQGTGSVAIGYQSGQTNQAANSIAIGPNAGSSTQGTNAIAIGVQAGQTIQNTLAIAIGFQAGQGTQGQSAIAIGQSAGKFKQNSGSISIGTNAGTNTQGTNSIAIFE
jgi:hypothetical protein